MRRFAEAICDIFFPPSCISCGELVYMDYPEKSPALCEECAPHWRRARTRQCQRCFHTLSKCRCVPPLMKKSGIGAMLKLVPWGSNAFSDIPERAILGIKTVPRGRTFSFFARELAPELTALVRETNVKLAGRGNAVPETVVSFLPRRKNTVLRFGFDQAREIAKELARETDLAFLPLLKRKRDGLAQKTLTQAERIDNMKQALAVVGDPSGKRVVLVDDIVTTGASMAAAATLLLAAGASEVVAVSVAVTEKKEKRHFTVVSRRKQRRS